MVFSQIEHWYKIPWNFKWGTSREQPQSGRMRRATKWMWFLDVQDFAHGIFPTLSILMYTYVFCSSVFFCSQFIRWFALQWKVRFICMFLWWSGKHIQSIHLTTYVSCLFRGFDQWLYYLAISSGQNFISQPSPLLSRWHKHAQVSARVETYYRTRCRVSLVAPPSRPRPSPHPVHLSVNSQQRGCRLILVESVSQSASQSVSQSQITVIIMLIHARINAW